MSDVSLACAAIGGQTLLSTRMMFAKHIDGHAFPATMSVKHHDDDFVCAIQVLQSKTNYLLFLSKSLTVTAATEGSVSAMKARFCCCCCCCCCDACSLFTLC